MALMAIGIGLVIFSAVMFARVSLVELSPRGRVFSDIANLSYPGRNQAAAGVRRAVYNRFWPNCIRC
jgi:hypothetical protein